MCTSRELVNWRSCKSIFFSSTLRVSFTQRPLYYLANFLWYPTSRRLSGPQNPYGRLIEQENLITRAGNRNTTLVCPDRRQVAIPTTPLRLRSLQQLRIIKVFPCLNWLDLILGSRFLPCSSSSAHLLPRTSIFLLSHFLLCSWGYSIPFILSRPPV